MSAHRRVPIPAVSISERSLFKYFSDFFLFPEVSDTDRDPERLSVFCLSVLLFEANNMWRLANVHKQRCAQRASAVGPLPRGDFR